MAQASLARRLLKSESWALTLAEKNVLLVGRLETRIDEGIKWGDEMEEDGRMGRRLDRPMDG